MPFTRAILHVDMDAFFASIEQLDDPALRGRPVLVGHDGPRGVVAAASYEARPFGCRSAQPIAMAKRLCPRAVIVPVRGSRYRDMSARVFAVFDQFTPLVEPLSIDEAFLDVSGNERLMGGAVDIAKALRRRIKDETQLTASVGVAPNKFVAKLASDMDKPDGLTVAPFDRDELQRWLATLPITRMWGVGPATAARLDRLGVRTFGDLQRDTPACLRDQLGGEAERFTQLARGIDDRPVTPDHRAKSIGQEQTFGADVTDLAEVRRVLMEQVEQVGGRLRRHGLRTRGVTVKIRYGDFETITRAATLPDATDITAELWRAARDTFDRWAAASYRPVRLIGVAATRLTDSAGQLDLFPDPQRDKERRVDQATDAIRARFGKQAIRRVGDQGKSGAP